MKDVTLSLVAPRATFWRGELFFIDLEVTNRGPHGIVVPPPDDADHGRFRYDLVSAMEGRAVDAAALARAFAPPRAALAGVELPAGRTLRAAVPIGAWARPKPGSYTLRARWLADDGEIASEPFAFTVVAPRAVSLALPAEAFVERPASLAGEALVTGEGLSHLFERRFGPDLEADDEYLAMGDVEEPAPVRPPTAVVRVAAAADGSLGFRAWVDDGGLSAKAGRSVRDFAGARWPDGLPEGSRVEIAEPAVETKDHELLALALATGDATEAKESTILAFRFARPVVVVEEADPNVPGDWDDEDTVSGPARVDRVGMLPGKPLARGALALGPERDDARLVAPFSTWNGLSLAHVLVRGARVAATAPAVFAGARAIPGCGPAVYVDATGESVARMLAVRPRDDGAFDLLLLGARFSPEGAHTDVRVWAGCLSAMPRAAAVAFSSVAAERPFCLGLVLGDDGRRLAVDEGGRIVRDVSLRHPPLEPLSFLVTRHTLHVAVRGESGPLLATARLGVSG